MDDRALMQMALDALKVVNDVGVSANWHRHFDNQIKALRERLAQPEPKPYDPMENNADYERGFIDGRQDQMRSSVDKAVNRMARREWVGLTDDEEDEIAEDWGRDRLPDIHSVTKAIEAKLKEKNA
jgi:hypothetical protein